MNEEHVEWYRLNKYDNVCSCLKETFRTIKFLNQQSHCHQAKNNILVL